MINELDKCAPEKNLEAFFVLTTHNGMARLHESQEEYIIESPLAFYSVGSNSQSALSIVKNIDDSIKHLNEHNDFFEVGSHFAKFFDRSLSLCKDTSCLSASRPAWLAHVIELCEKNDTQAALKEISIAVMKIENDNMISVLSSELEKIHLKDLPDVILIGLLRNVFTFRSRLTCWQNLLSNVESLLLERGREPYRLLRGLKDYA